MTKRESQIGSTLPFFIIGIILTCLLVGSIFYLKNRGESVRLSQKESTSKVSEQKDEKTAKTTTDNDKETVTKSDDSAQQPEVAVTSNDLPTTGPESTVTEFILLFAATFIISSFLQSRALKRAYSADR